MSLGLNELSNCDWFVDQVKIYGYPILRWVVMAGYQVNTLRSRQDGRYFADDVLKWFFLIENVWISLKIPLKFVPKGPVNNIPALVQIMAWRRPGDKPLSEPMLVFLPTHICVTRPQWVNTARFPSCWWHYLSSSLWTHWDLWGSFHGLPLVLPGL